MRINERYKIIYSSKIDDTTEIVLGQNIEDGMFVTWVCANGKSYFWGHYFSNESNALIDLAERIMEERKNG